MFQKYLVVFCTITLCAAACSTKTVTSNDFRTPAGTGDVDSSTPDMALTVRLESYKLPLVRDGKTIQKMAHNFWSGEWPAPVIDVSAKQKGTTKISAYKNLRNPTADAKVDCTIKNGLYHPWSDKDPSIKTYYTLTDLLDYKVIKAFTQKETYMNGNKPAETIYPLDAEVINVVYYGENYCGATLKIGKNLRPVAAECPFFMENPNLKLISGDSAEKFREQWLYLTCEEKDEAGKNLKAFVRDQDLLSQPGVKDGCFADYGKVQICR